MRAAQNAAERRRSARPGRILLLVVIVLASGLLGAWRVVALVSPPTDPMTVRIGSVAFTITHVDQVAGLTDADLGGMSHGVQSLVSDDQALVRVALTLTAGDTDADYDATALRAAEAGRPEGAAPVAGTLPLRGRLAAHSRLEGSLSYVLPRDGARLVLRAGSHEIPLVDLDDIGEGGGEHGHSEDPPSVPGPSVSAPAAPLPGYAPPTSGSAPPTRP